MNRLIIVIAGLSLALILAIIFAFLQTQSLAEIQDTSTQVVADLNSVGTQQAEESANTATQAAIEAIGSSTAQANIANSTATQAADNAVVTITQLSNNTIATSTAQANIANSTATHIVRVNNANQQRNQATATQQAANVRATDTEQANITNNTATQQAANVHATDTEQANIANSTATQAANRISTQAAISTNTAQQVATAYIEATVSVLVYSEVQTAIEAENSELLMTIDATGYTGEGIFGGTAELPNNFTLFRTEGYEIALPETFIVGDFANGMTDDLEDTMGDLDLSASYEILETVDGLVFFSVDTEVVNRTPRATVSLIREANVVEGTTLEDYFASSYFGIQGNFALISADILPINGQLTARSIIDQELSDGAVRQLQYIFTTDDGFYVLTYTSPITEYANIRSDLEISATTLRISE